METIVQRRSEQTTIGAPAERVLRPSPPRPIAPVGRARQQYKRLYLAMAITDSLSVALALLLAYEIRSRLSLPPAQFLQILGLTPVVVLVVFSAFRLYGTHHFTPAEEFRRILLAVTLGVTALGILSFWSRWSFSRFWVAMSWLLALVFALVTRRLWHYYAGRARAKGRLTFRTLIVGTNDEAAHLSRIMGREGLGFLPVGFVTTKGPLATNGSVPVVGSIDEIRELIRETSADCVFVATSSIGVQEMGHVAKAVRLEGVEVRVTATLPQVLSSRISVQPVGGVMALSLKPVRLSGSQAVAKRVFDLVCSSAGVLVTLPLWAAIAVAIKLTSPGPVLYRQQRVGQRGSPFTMLKFRTMRVGAEAMLDDLRRLNEATGPLFKLKDDPRVTGVGRWLRKWSLDEVPQLLNVLRGNMSLVGPRPPLPEEVREYEDWQFDRLEVPPGITGLWQVSGRSELSFDEYVRLDRFYIENWSLAYDLFILAKTIPMILARKGAY
jgi:exopolysaccharide biosynthesis polyprenyl glycosylphosphotransferase